MKVRGGLAGKTVDIAAINSPYVDVIINDASASLKAAGAKVANVERYNLPLASFATQAGTIARDKPAVVLILGSTDDTVVVSKALTSAGVKRSRSAYRQVPPRSRFSRPTRRTTTR